MYRTNCTVRVKHISDFVLLAGLQADKRLWAVWRQPLAPHFCLDDDNFHSSASPPNILNLSYFKWSLLCSLPPPDGATARDGPWPPLQYASRPLGSMLSLSPFVYTHLSQVHGHLIQPSHSWSSSSSCCIQLSVHLFFWDCGVLHSFYMTKPSYSLAFNKPDNVDYGF